MGNGDWLTALPKCNDLCCRGIRTLRRSHKLHEHWRQSLGHHRDPAEEIRGCPGSAGGLQVAESKMHRHSTRNARGAPVHDLPGESTRSIRPLLRKQKIVLQTHKGIWESAVR